MSNPDVIGPCLPPHLVPAAQEDEDESSSAAIGPVPQTPSTSIQAESSNKLSYGPSLPPGMICDPSVPENTAESDESDNEIIGPVLPTNDTSGDDWLNAKKREIEARAQAMKNKITKSDKEELRRGSWMTELPSSEIRIGLGPRKFRSSHAELGDQSVWTDTPADKARKAAKATEMEKDPLRGVKADTRKHKTANVISERDRQLAKQVEEYNKRYRSETLAEISRKRQKEVGSEAPKEKKMFDRETDLQLPKIMSQGKRKEVLNKSARDLQSKFTHGSQSHFL